MRLPLMLLACATIAGGLLAYGTHPDWAYWRHGVQLIIFTRRAEWLLALAAILPCMGLLGLVVAGRHRAWWLIGLAPVLALFIRTYGPGYRGNRLVAESPLFVDAALAGSEAPAADDWVVGVIDDGQAYALPMAQLYGRPVVLIGGQTSERVLVVWSATANRALAVVMARDAHASDLEIVSRPADALLLTDNDRGGFICGLTGEVVTKAPESSQAAAGAVGLAGEFVRRVGTVKMTYGDWLAGHGDTRVLVGFDDVVTAPVANAPRWPVMPLLRFRQADGSAPTEARPIDCVETPMPCAFPADVDLATPVNARGGGESLLLIRNGRVARAFDRHLKADLFLTFAAHRDRRRADVTMADSETGSLWTADGMCVRGQLAGQRLRELDVDEGLYLPVMRFWEPGLSLIGEGGGVTAGGGGR